MDPNKANDFDKTMEIPVQEPAADNDIFDKTIIPMSKAEFFEAGQPKDDTIEMPAEEMPEAEIPVRRSSARRRAARKAEARKAPRRDVVPDEIPEDEDFAEEPTGPRIWVPVLISCIAMIVMCISLITTYVVPVLYENGMLSGMVKIVSPIIGAEEAPKDTNVLIFGVDKDGYRTDTIMIARYDDTAKTVSVMQIQRDTYVGGNGRTDKKINSSYFSGIDQLKKEIKMAYGIDVHKYASLDLEGFRKLVDLLGGVEVYVPINMDYDDPEQNLHIHLKKGTQVLDGKKAEGFVRFRKNNDGVDYNRALSQKEFVTAMFKKAATPEGIMKAPEMISLAGKYLTTDLSYPEIMAYATTILELPQESITFMECPGTSGLRMGGWYFFVDKEAAADIAIEFFGAEPTLRLTPDNIPAASEPEPEESEPAPAPEEEPAEEPEEEEEPPAEEEPEESGEATEEEGSEPPAESEPPAATQAPEATEKPVSTPKPMGTARPVEKPEATPVPADIPKHTPLP